MTVRPVPTASAQGCASGMPRSLHDVLVKIVGVLALLIVVLCAWLMSRVVDSTRDAELYSHAAQVMVATLEAYVAVSDERGRTAGALGYRQADPGTRAPTLDAVRDLSNRAHHELLRTIAQTHPHDRTGSWDGRGQLTKDFAELAKTRQRVDMLIGGRGPRLGSEEWLATPTQYNETLGHILRDHITAVYGDGHSSGQMALGLLHLYRAIKYVGLTRATVMAAVSAGRPLEADALDRLDRYRWFKIEIQTLLGGQLQLIDGPSRQMVRDRYDTLLALAVTVSRTGQPIPLTGEAWYAASSAHLDAYIMRSRDLIRQIQTEAGTLQTRVRYQVAMLLVLATAAILTLLGTVRILRGRFLRPLEALGRAADAVIRGDLETPIRPGRRDEIGAVATAIEGMRSDLLHRMTAIAEAEASVRVQEARLRNLLDNAGEAIISIDQAQRIVLFNKAAETIFGYPQAEILGQPLETLLPEDYERCFGHIGAFAADDVAHRSVHEHGLIRGRRRSGEPFPAEASLSKLEVNGESILTLILRDVTERLRAEDSQKRLTDIIESTMDIVGTTDMHGRVTYLNAAGRALLGFDDQPARNALALTQLLAPWAAAQYRSETLPHVLRDGVWQGDSALIDAEAEGREIPVSHLVLRHEDTDGQVYLSFSMRDTAELTEVNRELEHRNRELLAAKSAVEQTQAQLVQSEKLAAVGQLAAGVAHEINNPIGYVSSNVTSLAEYVSDLLRLLGVYEDLERTPDVPAGVLARLDALKQQIDLPFLRGDAVALVRESQEGLSRVRKIVQDLREFTHAGHADWQTADLHACLESTLNIVRNEIKYKAEVVREYGELPLVECMPGQLNQVFMNLMVNAAQAIEERGTITFRTGIDGAGVFFEIEDDGPGMSEQVCRRIFDPFFTTKPVGKGTGLGLSVSYNVVRKHHGRIDVDSRPGHGTRFRVWIPVRQQTATEQCAVSQGDAGCP